MRKIPISLSIDDELLDQVDEICELNGFIRSQWISDIIQEKLDHINETIAEQERHAKEKNNGC